MKKKKSWDLESNYFQGLYVNTTAKCKAEGDHQSDRLLLHPQLLPHQDQSNHSGWYSKHLLHAHSFQRAQARVTGYCGNFPLERVLQGNSFFAHHENILIGMLRDENEEVRRQAVLYIRQRKKLNFRIHKT